QFQRRFTGNLDGDALAPAIGFADEVDAQCVIELRLVGMVVIDVGGVDPHPAAVRSLGGADEPGLLDNVRAHESSPGQAALPRCLWKKANALAQPSAACSARKATREVLKNAWPAPS